MTIRSHRRPHRARHAAVTLACLAAFSSTPSQALDVVWAGGTGSWGDALAWSGLAVPNASFADVFIDGGKLVASVVTLSQSVAIGTLRIDSGDALTVAGGAQLTLHGGTVINAGTFTLAGNNSYGYAKLELAADTTLSGNGQTVLSADTGGYSGYVYGRGHTLSIANGHTLRGAGTVGADDLNLINQGTVIADGAGPLYLALGAGKTFDNSAGLVKVGDGAKLLLSSGTLSGGTVQSLGNGTLGGAGTFEDVMLAGNLSMTHGGTLSRVAVGGNLTVVGGATVYAKGTLVTTGTFTLAGDNSYGYARLELAADTTLSGSGQTVLSADTGGYSGYVYGRGHTLSIASGHTLRGAGTVGADDLNLINRGTVFADSASPLTVALGAGNTFDNSAGLVKVGDGAKLLLSSGTLSGGTVQGLGVGGGTLGGAGTFEDVRLAGNLSMTHGGTLSRVSVGGNLTVVGGATVFAKGTLVNTGTITLAGNNNFGYAKLELAADTTLSGNGQTVLSADTGGYSGYVYGRSHSLSIASGHTLRGAGTVGADDLNMVNRGTVFADSASPLYLALGAGNTFDNSAGLVKIADGAKLLLSSGTLSGGTVQGLGHSVLAGAGLYRDLALTGTLAVAAGSSVNVAGNLANTGSFTLAGSNNYGNSTLRLAADTTLSGSGQTVLSADTGGYSGYVYGQGHTLTIGSGHTLRGAGTLGDDKLNVINQGAVVAEGTSALTLNLGTGKTFDNSTGLVKITDGAKLLLSSGTLSGGMVQGPSAGTGGGTGTLGGGGTFEDVLLAGNFNLTTGSTLSRIALSGNLTVVGGATVYAQGTLANTGSFTLAGDNSFGYATLRLAADSALSGNGQTVLSADTGGYSGYVYGQGHTLTIGSGHTLRGAGTLGGDDLNVINHGIVLAENTSPLTLNLGAGKTFDNSTGLVKIVDGAKLVLSSGTLSGGTVQGLGQSILAGGGLYRDLALNGTLAVAAGTSVNIAGNVSNTGTLLLAGSNSYGNANLKLAADTTFSGNGQTVLAADTGGYSGYVYGQGHTLTIGNGHTLTGVGTVGAQDIVLLNHGVLAPGAAIGKLAVGGTLVLASDSTLQIDVAGLARGTQYDWLAVEGNASLGGGLNFSFGSYAAQVGDSFSFLSFSGSSSGHFSALSASGYTLSLTYGAHDVTATVTGISAVPEPQSWALMLLGLAGLAGLARRHPSR